METFEMQKKSTPVHNTIGVAVVVAIIVAAVSVFVLASKQPRFIKAEAGRAYDISVGRDITEADYMQAQRNMTEAMPEGYKQKRMAQLNEYCGSNNECQMKRVYQVVQRAEEPKYRPSEAQIVPPIQGVTIPPKQKKRMPSFNENWGGY